MLWLYRAKNFYYSYVKKHRSCWELVGSLLATCSEVKSRSGRFSIVTGLVVDNNAAAYNRTVFFFSRSLKMSYLVDFHFPCLTMIPFFFVIYSFYSLHVWELLA